MIIVEEMTRGNFSFLILVVGIIQILVMIWTRKKSDVTAMTAPTGKMENARQRRETMEIESFLREAYNELNEMPCGESWIEVDGEMKRTDVGYAFEGIKIFLDYCMKKWEGRGDD